MKNECVWCYTELNEENTAENWCDPCCKDCAKHFDEMGDDE